MSTSAPEKHIRRMECSCDQWNEASSGRENGHSLYLMESLPRRFISADAAWGWLSSPLNGRPKASNALRWFDFFPAWGRHHPVSTQGLPSFMQLTETFFLLVAIAETVVGEVWRIVLHPTKRSFYYVLQDQAKQQRGEEAEKLWNLPNPPQSCASWLSWHHPARLAWFHLHDPYLLEPDTVEADPESWPPGITHWEAESLHPLVRIRVGDLPAPLTIDEICDRCSSLGQLKQGGCSASFHVRA